MTDFFRRIFARTWLTWTVTVAASVAAGFYLSRHQLINIDDAHNIGHGEWLLSKYGLGDPIDTGNLPNVKWYGPLFDLLVALASRTVFFFLHNPFWVERAFGFALLPVTCLAVASLLRKAGVRWSAVVLCVVLLLGNIRFGGHAMFNQKDFPFACAYLVSTLFLWLTVTRWQKAKTFTTSSIVSATVVCMLPFLIRPVPPVHFALLYGYLIYACVGGRIKGALEKATILALPLAVAFVAVFALYPVLWETPVSEWIPSFKIFLSYPWGGTIRIFETTFSVPGDRLPWWYLFAWVPVMMEPVSLALVLLGLCASFWWMCKSLPSPLAAVRAFFSRRAWAISLEQWLWAAAAFTWGSVLVLRPVLYDEERHLLFLFPFLPLLAGLGLRRLSSKAHYALASMVVVVALLSYLQWGRYAYVYKNPLVTGGTETEFMGDYWGACVAKAVLALPQVVPAGTGLSYRWMELTVPKFQQVMRQGLPAADPAVSSYPGEDLRTGKSHAMILISRLETFETMTRDVQNRRARVVWEERMPPNDRIACLILYYPPGHP